MVYSKKLTLLEETQLLSVRRNLSTRIVLFAFTMSSNLSSATDVINWNRRILGFLGNWPEDTRNFRCSLILGYLLIHLTLAYAYLCQNIKILEHVVASMTESIPFTVVLVKAVFFRTDRNLLCKVIRKVKNNFHAKDYRSYDEVDIFLKYNRMAKNFTLVAVPMVLSSSICYFAKPLFIQLLSIGGNGTSIFNLPYRVSLFYEVTDVRVHALIYALQSPLVLIVTFGYTGTDCLMVTLSLHVCSELSVLAIRLRNLKYDDSAYDKALRTLINQHVELIQMARMIEDAFNISLLGQLFGGIFLICFLGYNVLANTTGGQETDLLNFLLYGFSVVALLYVYCYIGDCLTHESIIVRDAFFYCPWYELPVQSSKSIVTCIIQAQKPLHLTAGKFYIFSLERFTYVIKTAAAYLSVLQTFV